MQIEKLIKAAIEQLAFSYSPYSNFKVAAALLDVNGQIHLGSNIENAAYTPSNCAERTAFFKAVSQGIKEFKAIAVVGGPDGILTDYCPPCGVCLQVMMEFCDSDQFQIIVAKSVSDYEIMTLRQLLPRGFGPSNLT